MVCPCVYKSKNSYWTHRATIIHQVLMANIAMKRAAKLRLIARTPLLIENSIMAEQVSEGQTKVKT